MVFCVNPTNVHGNHGYMKKASVSHQGGRKEGGIGSTGSAPHTLTLFKTKIADFPTLFKIEFRFLIPCLRHLTRNKKKNKFAVVYFVEHTRRLFIVQEKIPCLRQKLIKSIPCLRQKMIKSIPCLRQNSRKTNPGWPHVPIKLL